MRPRQGVRAALLTTTAAVVKLAWPAYAVLIPLTLGSLLWWIWSGDRAFVTLTARWWIVTLGGLVGSFLVHELAHALLLLRIPGVTRVRLETSVLRISQIPEGSLTRAESALVALSGPIAAATVGAVLLMIGTATGWWYLMHLLFLLPPFGDGMVLLGAARSVAARRRGAPH